MGGKGNTRPTQRLKLHSKPELVKAAITSLLRQRVEQLQKSYSIADREFWALAVAVEALKFATSVCAGRDAADELRQVWEAIADYEAAFRELRR